jgi:hypothetical protein
MLYCSSPILIVVFELSAALDAIVGPVLLEGLGAIFGAGLGLIPMLRQLNIS